ncbi:MAG: hypothetical protein JW384_03038 [Nitrosomonadaceae bacterium]|nr:hypothetical protein [Nitrosomonadaceae bacterium]
MLLPVTRGASLSTNASRGIVAWVILPASSVTATRGFTPTVSIVPATTVYSVEYFIPDRVIRCSRLPPKPVRSIRTVSMSLSVPGGSHAALNTVPTLYFPSVPGATCVTTTILLSNWGTLVSTPFTAFSTCTVVLRVSSSESFTSKVIWALSVAAETSMPFAPASAIRTWCLNSHSTVSPLRAGSPAPPTSNEKMSFP